MNSLTFNRYRNFAEKVLILDSGALSIAYQKTYGNLKLCFDVRSGNAYHLCRWKQKYISKVQLYFDLEHQPLEIFKYFSTFTKYDVA